MQQNYVYIYVRISLINCCFSTIVHLYCISKEMKSVVILIYCLLWTQINFYYLMLQDLKKLYEKKNVANDDESHAAKLSK